MAGKIKDMSKVKQMLRLHQNGVSNRQIAAELSVNKETVNRYIKRAKHDHLTIEELLKLEDPVLQHRMTGGNPAYPDNRFEELKGKLSYFEEELKRKHVILQTLWEEYIAENPNGYSLTQFRYHYRQHTKAKRKTPSSILKDLYVTGEKLEEMTYREILDNGKEWKAEQEKIEAEQKALAEKAKKEEEARIKRLTESVLVSCYSKSFAEYDYQEYITYKFVIQNKSDKGIRAVKGSISFTNLFDNEIKSLSFVYDQPIAAGKEVTWNAQTDYNQFMDDDVALKNKDLKDLKVVWKPEKIIFEGGTTLE